MPYTLISIRRYQLADLHALQTGVPGFKRFELRNGSYAVLNEVYCDLVNNDPEIMCAELWDQDGAIICRHSKLDQLAKSKLGECPKAIAETLYEAEFFPDIRIYFKQAYEDKLLAQAAAKLVSTEQKEPVPDETGVPVK